MSGHGYWTCEHDWEISAPRWRKPRETVLCILFDNGAQRQFSSVHITLVHNNEISPKQIKAWHIVPQPSSLSVVSRVSPVTEDTPVNDASLPICNIVFVIDRHSSLSQSSSKVAKVCGELVLSELILPEDAGNTLFEFNQPLTGETQSVSVSFTSTNLLYTMMSRGVWSLPSADRAARVCRVVRVFSVVPIGKRRTISLPIDVIVLILENLRFLSEHCQWRRNILSCALVCRRWTQCALDMLLVDFRPGGSQKGHPPEIVSFANGLAAYPSLALGIKFLSIRYLERHPTWNPYPEYPFDYLPQIFLAQMQSQQGVLRRSQFGRAFLSILLVAENVEVLHLDPRDVEHLVNSPDEFADALRKLNKMEEFDGRCPLTMAQLLSCVAAWPLLKHLTITSALPPGKHSLPLAMPSCRLTEITFTDIPIRDDELRCFVNASGSTLGRLGLIRISQLTNAGLMTTLNIVCTSLTSLRIMSNTLPRKLGEEHALDVIIVRMLRLTELRIESSIASERMLARRAEAFSQQTTAPIPEVHLVVIPTRRDLGEAAERDWPGWRIEPTWPQL